MYVRRILMCALLAAGLVALMAPGAAATKVSGGLSGQCYDTEGNGGQDEARATVDTEDPTNPDITLLTVTGTVAALTQFVVGTVESGGQVGEACSNEDTLDYLETGACVDDTCVQVCYQGSTDPEDVVFVGERGCPTSPAGPGGPG